MSLTNEIIKADSNLSSLTEEQINAIVTLSANDENQVIGKKIGEIYGLIDNDVFSVSNIAKEQNEKTYDYIKRTLKSSIDNSSSYSKQVADLTKEKARLEKVIADGLQNDEATKQLKQAQADLNAITKQFNDLNAKHEKMKNEHTKQLYQIQVDGVINSASSSLKFKQGFNEQVKAVLLNQAIAKVKSFNNEFIDNGTGGKTLVFKGEDGSYLRNPANKLEFFTASELLEKELNDMGVLETRQQGGGGGVPPTNQSSVVDLSGCRNRVEATDFITSMLQKQGIARHSAEFQVKFNEIWNANNIQQLPLR